MLPNKMIKESEMNKPNELVKCVQSAEQLCPMEDLKPVPIPLLLHLPANHARIPLYIKQPNNEAKVN